MSVWRLVFREILYRKLNFGLAILAVLAATGCLVAVLTLLRLHDQRTEELVAAREAETAEKMRKLEDDYRKITKNLGFNVLILPRDQNLGDLYAEDYASKYMPEEYAERLAKSKIVTVNHLLPSLQQRIVWKERQRTILLVGVRGEVPILHQKDAKKPLLDAVPPGTMVVGHELHASLGLKKGDRVALQGREFTVHKLHAPRGTRDDITVWINLREAQELLGKTGQINGILALECNCASPDRLGDVRQEIAAILPDTQVIEKASEALARAEARNTAAAAAKDAIAREKRGRAELRAERETFAAVLAPLVLLGATVWVGLLAFTNVRDRSGEIGILRALGLGSVRVFGLFLARAVLVGFVGALLGYLAGSLVGMLFSETAGAVVFDLLLLGLVVLAAPLLCALASWVPALLAAKQDPAVVLREG